MNDLVVRIYNVGFGDAVLVTIPERSGRRTVERHLLIDVGQVLADDEKLLTTVVDDIRERTGGTVDLYVMTHEHLDHAQGLLAAHLAGVDLSARYAWLTQSAHPDYYTQFPDARKKLDEARLTYLDALQRFAADDQAPLGTRLMLENNRILLNAAGGLKTADYVDHLRSVAPEGRTHYVSRGTKGLRSKHPFKEATIKILAPEEDTSSYYGRYTPPKLLEAAAGPAATTGRRRSRRVPTAPVPVPPAGVDAGAFFDLLRARDRQMVDGLAEIDRAANNTSLVLLVEWRGWRLLFPGDAEERSWKTMRDQGLLSPVHFVKVSHHGSVNGTVPEILGPILPPPDGDGRQRRAAISTADGHWDSVPDDDTVGFYGAACSDLLDTRTIRPGDSLELRFSG